MTRPCKGENARSGIAAGGRADRASSGPAAGPGLHQPRLPAPFDNAALDGYALASADAVLDAGAELEIVGCQAAGAPPRFARGAWKS